MTQKSIYCRLKTVYGKDYTNTLKITNQTTIPHNVTNSKSIIWLEHWTLCKVNLHHTIIRICNNPN